jgi:hypothetical protein
MVQSDKRIREHARFMAKMKTHIKSGNVSLISHHHKNIMSTFQDHKIKVIESILPLLLYRYGA